MNRESIENEIDAAYIAAEIVFEFLSMRIRQVLSTSGHTRGGSSRTVRQMRMDSTRGNATASKVEAVRRTPKNEPVRAASRKAGNASKAYWAKMTPEQRSAEMQRRRQVSLPKKKGEAA